MEKNAEKSKKWFNFTKNTFEIINANFSEIHLKKIILLINIIKKFMEILMKFIKNIENY